MKIKELEVIEIEHNPTDVFSRCELILHLNNNSIMMMCGEPYKGVFYTDSLKIGIPVGDENINTEEQYNILKKSGIDLDKDGVYEEVCMQIVESIQKQHNSRFTSRNGEKYIIQFDDLEAAKGGNKIESDSRSSEKISSDALEEQERSVSSQSRGIFGKCKKQKIDKQKNMSHGKEKK